MNQVSEINLAIAVAKAGAMPSLMLYNSNNETFASDLKTNMAQFKSAVGNTDIVLCVPASFLRSAVVCDTIILCGVKFIEIFPSHADTNTFMMSRGTSPFDGTELIPTEYTNSEFLNNINFLKDAGVKILMRMVWEKQPVHPFADVLCIKGADSAGIKGSKTVKERFMQFLETHPTMPLIPYGGISSSDDVDFYINNGAAAVAVGTLFAACDDSRLSNETKNKMIEATSKDLTSLDTSGQSALVFTTADKTSADDINRTSSLVKGISSAVGHIYAGTGIDGVTTNRTAHQVVRYLSGNRAI
tara:strand:- start:797 stop:1699 length:903 start_codon:yes stop_codon:yes gene_type:complete